MPFEERTRHKAWTSGYWVQLDRKGEYEHFVGGACGGGLCDWQGGDCPNCHKPLIQHMRLDTRDPRLKLQELGVPELPLLYCGRCGILERPLVYRVESPGRIQLILFHPDSREDIGQHWRDDGLPDVFPERSIELHPIPDWMQNLVLSMNSGRELTAEEEVKAGAEARTYWPDGRPYFDGYPRQVGGIPYFDQDWAPPECAACTELRRETEMC
ncbi:MAG: hypothetical protein ACYSVY_27400, partial [Planctomycetota bacterium]